MRVLRGGFETLGTVPACGKQVPNKLGRQSWRLTARWSDLTSVFHGPFSETVPDTFVFCPMKKAADRFD